MNVLVIMTCFNRKENTEMCIKSLSEGNRNLSFTYVIVDDNSKDGTVEKLEKLRKNYKIFIIKGSGNLYYSGGMRMGMEYAINNLEEPFDYFLMVNDDVEFFENCIEKMLSQVQTNRSVIVGATCDKKKRLTYGAIKYIKKNSIKYQKVGIKESDLDCDTFNANCVVIPYTALKEVGSIDSNYLHSLGDFDYGLSLKNKNYNIKTSNQYVGFCGNNSVKNTWQDRSLSITNRIRLKENPKGAPIKNWFYFLHKNFGLIYALIYSVSPYMKIILKR